MRQHRVGSVTTGANGSDGQTALKQTLAVDAVDVVREDVGLRDVVRLADGCAFAVAAAAQLGNLDGGDGRSRAGCTQHIVGTVAVLARWSEPVPAGCGTAMQAGRVLRLLVRMAA